MKHHRGYADGPFGQVHFQVYGEGSALLMCHQSPSSLRQFDAVYPLLADAGIMAIGVDTPGFGMSDVPTHIPAIADYSDSVTAVLDELGLKNADILGQHTGSMVAMEATIRHPARYRRLIMNTPTPMTVDENQQWKAKIVGRQRAFELRRDGSHLVEVWNRRVSVSQGWTDLRAMNKYVLQILNSGDTVWYGHNAAFSYDQLGRLPLITHDCLLLNNTGDGLYEISRRANQARPEFREVVLQGGTHDIADEQPQAWTNAVAEFCLR